MVMVVVGVVGVGVVLLRLLVVVVVMVVVMVVAGGDGGGGGGGGVSPVMVERPLVSAAKVQTPAPHEPHAPHEAQEAPHEPPVSTVHERAIGTMLLTMTVSRITITSA